MRKFASKEKGRNLLGWFKLPDLFK